MNGYGEVSRFIFKDLSIVLWDQRRATDVSCWILKLCWIRVNESHRFMTKAVQSEQTGRISWDLMSSGSWCHYGHRIVSEMGTSNLLLLKIYTWLLSHRRLFRRNIANKCTSNFIKHRYYSTQDVVLHKLPESFCAWRYSWYRNEDHGNDQRNLGTRK